jgi:hypothetical protein
MRPWALLLSALLAAPTEAGELYRWMDERGRAHFTDDLTRVPSRYRDRAMQSAFPDSRVTMPAAPAAPAPAAEPPIPEPATRHVIQVEKAGLEVTVAATLNGRLTVPFTVDTGAMINTLPRPVAEELGLLSEDEGRRVVVVGVSGEPMVVPIVRLRQVDVGGAIVEDLDAAVLETLHVGLLGMPFFRHFRVSLDPVAGSMELEKVDLSKIEGLYGGYPESYWRGSFRTVAHQLDAIEKYRRQIPPVFEHLHEKLDSAERYWRSEGERLDVEASRAGVPRAWRE